jgi:hypothetical protein
MQRRSYWSVPSANGGGWYLVVLRPDGTTKCSCPAQVLGKGVYPCWHSMLVVALAGPLTQSLTTVYQRRRAKTGNVMAQLGIVTERIRWLAGLELWDALRLACRTQTQYVEAMGPWGRYQRGAYQVARRSISPERLEELR